MGSTNKTILIVENAGDWRELLTQVIDRSGYQVIEADSGTEAVRQAVAVHPDLILLDFGLSGTNAGDVMAELRANLATRDIPVVVQTMFDDHAGMRCAMKAGAREVLYKPFDLTDLPGILRKHLAGGNPMAQ